MNVISSGCIMQSHYGFIRSLNFRNTRTPYQFKKQFIIYSSNNDFLRKEEVNKFLTRNYSPLGYSHVLITRTKKPYTSAGNFVIPSRNNFQRFLLFLRVIKPNNSFLKIEAFHTGNKFQSSTLYESENTPRFLSLNNDAEITISDLNFTIKSMNRISRLKVEEKHRLNNFYSYLDQSIRGVVNHRIIWIFIAFESLFQLRGERGRAGERISKRVAYYLEPKDSTKQKNIYDSVFKAYKIRGEMVHGGVVDNDEIKKSLERMETLTWKIARKLLLSNPMWLKRFSSENELKKYFHWIDYKWGF